MPNSFHEERRLPSLAVIFGALIFLAHCIVLPEFGNAQNADADIERAEEEIGDKDFTNFSPRVTFKYDHKIRAEDSSTDRVRFRTLWSFGPRRRWAVSAEMPYLVMNSPADSTSGGGDLELKFGAIINRTQRFAQGAGIQVNAPTASAPPLGGNATIIKALYGNSLTLSSKWFLDFSFNAAFPAGVREGVTVQKAIEPEANLARAFPWFTAYLHSDNYYNWPISEWGNTIKFGMSKRFGERFARTIDVYWELPLNHYASQSFKHDIGVDVNIYF
jgi:hypothetical protein